ncbi:MAG: hypothetical protein EOO91_09425 [Pedobacter sp.]|nr:MAG: hypothetical protein EOO91_09425 [Pedobacter sp.]
MSLFELLGEKYNPGPVGSIDTEKRSKNPKPKYLFLKFIISLILLLTLEYAFLDSYQFNDKYFFIANGIMLFYLFCAYKINITPNTSNLGWVPFLIDNPFRFSDDMNRLSIILLIIFWPGKFISTSVIDYYNYKIN